MTACIDARAWLDAVELDAARGIVARLDPRRLDVILANLIGNALKHGGSPVRVSVRTDGDESSRSGTTVPASPRMCCRMSSTGSTRRALPPPRETQGRDRTVERRLLQHADIALSPSGTWLFPSPLDEEESPS
ncbi:hypothetical protein SANTM175S_08514 [Streptomyces antimycoticus]